MKLSDLLENNIKEIELKMWDILSSGYGPELTNSHKKALTKLVSGLPREVK